MNYPKNSLIMNDITSVGGERHKIKEKGKSTINKMAKQHGCT